MIYYAFYPYDIAQWVLHIIATVQSRRSLKPKKTGEGAYGIPLI